VGNNKHLIRIAIGLALFFIGFIVVVQLFSNVEADTIIVAKDGNGDYEKIQDAIDNATEGDTIRVWEGTFYENVVVKKTVSLIGNGSEETTIDGGGTGDVVRITSDWVNMSGFKVTGSGTNWPDAGISVESNKTHIFENNCMNNDNGVYLYKSNNSTLMNNTWESNNFHGIFLGSSSACTITNNTCSSNNHHGIYLWASNDCTITNNTCSSNNIHGIYLWDFSDCTITNNTCSNNNDYGILLSSSRDCLLEDNICSNNDYGIYLYSGSSDCTITNNNCSNNRESGIHIDSSSDCTITQNTCSNNDYGIYLSRSSDCTIMNNTCESNNRGGISLGASWGCRITNNTCSNNGYGIILWDSSSDCTVTNNTCSNNTHYGLNLASSASLNPTSRCTITNNKFSNNNYGIYLQEHSDNNTISNNTISENKIGIYLRLSSRNNAVHYNNIFNNSEYGINATNNGYTVNATYNWWGHDSGPYHPVNNSNGIGDNITDFMDFDPWTGKNSPPVATIQSVSPNPTLVGEIITFSGSGVDDGTITRYIWTIDGIEVYNDTQPEFTHSDLALGEHSITLWVQDDYGLLSEPSFETVKIVQLGVKIDGPKDQVNVRAGNETSVSLMIINTGGLVDSYQLEVISIDENFQRKREWISTLETILVELDPGENVTVDLHVSINGSVSSGEYGISIRAVSMRDAGVEDTTILTFFVNEQEEDDDGDEGGEGFIPGFGAVTVVGATGIAIVLIRRKEKKERK